MSYCYYIKKSQISGKMHKMRLGISLEDLDAGLAVWEGGATIQAAFPQLSADEREFILTGITPGEWRSLGREED
jgi:hypothetical protein